MAIATLSIDLEARLARLEQDLSRANASIDRFASRSVSSLTRIEGAMAKVEGLAKSFAAGFAGMFAVLAPAALVAAFTQFARATVTGLDALNDVSDATGATVENISALEDIAARTGTTIDTVSTALVKFNLELANAKPGSENANIFRKLGLDAEALKRVDPAEALRQTAVALAQFADDGDKARVVQALFGKSVKEVAPFLRDLAEAGQLNATVTTEQAKQAEKFAQALSRLQKNIVDFARALTGDALPALNTFLERLTLLASRMTFVESLKLGASQLFSGERFNSAQEALEGYNAKLAETRTRLAELQAGNTRSPYGGGANDGPIAKLQEEEKRLVRLTNLYRDMVNLGSAGQGRGGDPRQFEPKPGIGALPTADKKPSKTFDIVPLPKEYAEAFKRIDDADEEKLKRLRATLSVLTNLVSGGIDVPQSVFGQLAEDIAKLDPEAQKAAESTKRLQELLARTPGGKLAVAVSEIEFLNKAYETGRITVEQWAEAVRAASAGAASSVVDEVDKLDERIKRMEQNIQDAFGDTLLSALQGNFRNIGQLWLNLIQRMVAEAAGAKLMSALFGTATGGGGGLFAGAMKFLFSANGNAFDRGGLIPFASGGVVNGATPFMFGGGQLGVMGEAGPEAILPLKRGRDGRLGVAGSGGVVINQTINVQAGASRNEVAMAAMAAKRSAVAEIRDLMRRGSVAFT